MNPSAQTRERAVDKIARLAGEPQDLVSFWRASADVVAGCLQFDCGVWLTLDPASLLVTSYFNDGVDEVPRELFVAEYVADDVYKLADIARSPDGLRTLHDATDGDPRSTARWHRNEDTVGTMVVQAPRLLACDVIWTRINAG